MNGSAWGDVLPLRYAARPRSHTKIPDGWPSRYTGPDHGWVEERPYRLLGLEPRATENEIKGLSRSPCAASPIVTRARSG